MLSFITLKNTSAWTVFSLFRGSKSSVLALCGLLMACSPETAENNEAAPGAPGRASTWAYSGKTGIGTSYEDYGSNGYSGDAVTGPVSKTWFSLTHGIVTETMFGLIHEAQIKDLEFALIGEDFVDFERTDMVSEIDYLHKDDSGRPLSLAYKISNKDKDGRYEVEKHVFTDPDRNSLFLRLIVRTNGEAVTPVLLLNPHVANTGEGDFALAGNEILTAWDGENFLSLIGDRAFDKSSAGFVGVSDGREDLADNGQLDWTYRSTGSKPGNVALTAQLPPVSGEQVFHFVLSFGNTEAESTSVARATLAQGYDGVLAHYNGEGEHVGWEDYLASLSALPQIRMASEDGGKLAHASALVLKAQEDKTFAGALIASLSNPWGDRVDASQSATGYKAVWPRDFYQCAMAFLALGDTKTPLAAFNYLRSIQVNSDMDGVSGATGWFLQKTHVNGVREWVAVQLDQTAMPLMLASKLDEAGLFAGNELNQWYHTMLKPAADFLVEGGQVGVDWNSETVKPPFTQQERWEEQRGYSPSTTAAVVAGLISVSDIAKRSGDTEGAKLYRATAVEYASKIEKHMFTTTGAHNAGTDENQADGRYYLRITQNENPDDDGGIEERNGRPSMEESLILDAGFLELVRYGVRAPNDAYIRASLPEVDDLSIDDLLRIKYEFKGENGRTFPGWRRYGNDGYGESTVDGRGYDGGTTKTLRGRVWPFFTGERGHYELAYLAQDDDGLTESDVQKLRGTYIAAMEYFANEGLMLSEQVWDGVGSNEAYGYEMGQGTNSATPLAWTHAEYVKLLRSVSDGEVWDFYPKVAEQLKEVN